MILIAGLGNPGPKYDKTRHNVGFDTIGALAKKHGISLSESKFRALVGSGFLSGQKVLLVKPMTYMNLSGEAIGELIRFYKLDPAFEFLAVYDDISLEPGNLRIRKKGSAGGHNGIKSIIEDLGTQEFFRIKIGVGAKPPHWDLADYVLSRFSDEERELIEQAISDAVGAAEAIVSGDIEGAMNRYNQKKNRKE